MSVIFMVINILHRLRFQLTKKYTNSTSRSEPVSDRVVGCHVYSVQDGPPVFGVKERDEDEG